MSRFLTGVFFKGEEHTPTLSLSDNTEYQPLGKTTSISFDLSVRHCIGWHDLASGENHPCPESAETNKKYDTCPACQKRTGFNPAFYHASTISAKQEARNAEPHLLYLAYMGENYIKVGITWHKKGIKRLLDQGARAGLILDTFPTALIARQYEDKIARLSDMHETTATRTKLSLLSLPYSDETAKEQLLLTKQRINQELSIKFKGDDVLYLDNLYSINGIDSSPIKSQTEPRISGEVEALIGDILLTHYEGRRLALPLKQYTGYQIEIIDEITDLDLEPQQLQLF